MDKLYKIITSTRTTAVLFLLFIIAMAAGTFIENDYGTPAAKAVIYEAWWFELIMLLLIINFVNNIFVYRLTRREKLPLLIFHLSFILIFIGGAITRYISYEGVMRIREGSQSNEIITDKTYFKFQVFNQDDPRTYKDIACNLSPLSKNFETKYDYNGKIIRVKVLDFIPKAQDSLLEDPKGKHILTFVTTGEQGRKTFLIEDGEEKNIKGVNVSFNKENPEGIEFRFKNGQFFIKTPVDGSYMVMATQTSGMVSKDSLQAVSIRSLYNFQGFQFVIPQFPAKGKIIHFEGDKKKNEADNDMLIVETQIGNTRDTLKFYGGKGITGLQKKHTQAGITFGLGYGSKIKYAPFTIALRDFQIERYPGTDNPSSFASEVTVVDGKESFDYRIYMNHILDYRGFRFFQASYDADEAGTVLSVNHDFWGTTITYIGYAFLFLGMFLTLFWKGTRFTQLFQQLKEISKSKAVIILFSMLISLPLPAQHPTKTPQPKPSKIRIIPGEELASSYKFSKEHTDKFGHLPVLNFEGRVVPTHTLALDILRKIYKKDNFYSLDANQWLLAISIDPLTWTQTPLIKVSSKGGDELLKKCKVNEEGYTSLIQLFPIGFDGMPVFVLDKEFKEAVRKRPADQTNFDKEVIEINDKVMAMQSLLSGQYLRYIPLKNDPNNTWVSWMLPDFTINETANELLGNYFTAVMKGLKTGNWKAADAALERISAYQNKWGKEILPSNFKLELEVIYNQSNIFFRLMIAYSILAMLLLIFGILKLLTQRKIFQTSLKILLGILAVLFLLHLGGLAIRWYLSGHAPWSNGYEAVIFISWVGVLSGFVLYKNSNALIPAAGCLVAVIMMGFAHGGGQLNQQITPLVPVLKSYWLNIHVAIITSSYGFFALCAFLGLISLYLYIASSPARKEKFSRTLKELLLVNEISMTIGLFLLTIGTFLGGMWANESWGRYWSWDPKETWAFISVIVYAFILHLRLVPGARGPLIFNALSVWGFSTIIMTYFGVNYYLSGLHSYAKGDPVPIPLWVYIAVALVATTHLLAYFKFRKLKEVKAL